MKIAIVPASHLTPDNLSPRQILADHAELDAAVARAEAGVRLAQARLRAARKRRDEALRREAELIERGAITLIEPS